VNRNRRVPNEAGEPRQRGSSCLRSAPPFFRAALPALQGRLAEVCSQMEFIEISPEICDIAGRIAPGSRLCSLDAIHLATFEIVRRLDPSTEILTHDDRLLALL
jgi:hypothetical protein